LVEPLARPSALAGGSSRSSPAADVRGQVGSGALTGVVRDQAGGTISGVNVTQGCYSHFIIVSGRWYSLDALVKPTVRPNTPG
jgi:hypothetical protein